MLMLALSSPRPKGYIRITQGKIMNRKLAIAAVMAAFVGTGVSQAHAADGYVCYSKLFYQTSTPGYGTNVYPQVSNSTTFKCWSSTGYTMHQLSQSGWTIVQMAPVVYSMTASSDGTLVSRTRYQLVIQR
jgi:hypothetical protein